MKCCCEVSFKLAQSFFQWVPDQGVGSAAKAARWVVHLPQPAVLEVLCLSLQCMLRNQLLPFNLPAPGSEQAEGERRMLCSLCGAWQHLWALPARAAHRVTHRQGGNFAAVLVQNSWLWAGVCSSTSLKHTHTHTPTMELCIPPPPAQGFCFFGGGGGCFSVPADVNKIARWHFNALQRDRSLLFPGSRGSHSFAVPEVV